MNTAMTTSFEPLNISNLRDLPALPAAVLDLLDMLSDESIGTSALADKISHDVALTAKTLRLVNSSFYGVPRHVTTVTEATAMLGLRTVRVVVMAAALTGSFKPTCEGFDFNAFWRHSLSTAVAARLMATAVKADAEAAFTAGLLHDIGQLILATGFSGRYEQVLAEYAAGDTSLRDTEEALLGTNHTTVGALVAEHWRLPAQIVLAIGNHHALPGQLGSAVLAAVVHVANKLAHALELGGHEGTTAAALCGQMWAESGLSTEAWTQIVGETETQTQTICAVLLN